jgi:hypothetical protein
LGQAGDRVKTADLRYAEGIANLRNWQAKQEISMKTGSVSRVAIIAISLTVLGGVALAAQDRYALKTLAFIEKDSKRFPNTHGWAYAQWAYDPKPDSLAPNAPLSASGHNCGYACHRWCRRTTTSSRRIRSDRRVRACRFRPRAESNDAEGAFRAPPAFAVLQFRCVNRAPYGRTQVQSPSAVSSITTVT